MYVETTIYQDLIGEHSKINQKNSYHGKHQCAYVSGIQRRLHKRYASHLPIIAQHTRRQKQPRVERNQI